MIDGKAKEIARACWLSLAERQQWTQGTAHYGKPDAEHVLLGIRIASYVLTQVRPECRDADELLAALDAAADECDQCYERMFPEFERRRRERK